jgi:hypothetical protein
MDFQSITLNYPQNQRVNKISLSTKENKYLLSQSIKDQTIFHGKVLLEKAIVDKILENNKLTFASLKKSSSELGCNQTKFWIVEINNEKKIFCKSNTKEIAEFFNALDALIKK